MEELNWPRLLGAEGAWGVDVTQLLMAATVALASYLVMSVTWRVLVGRAASVAGRTDNPVDDALVEVLRGTNRWLIAVAALLIGIGTLDLPAPWSGRVEHLWFIALALQFALWGNRAVTIALKRYVDRHSSSGMTQVSASAVLLSWSCRTVLWTVVLLAVLSNLGVNITAFVASLGVGGIAVALAVQNVLGDLFASLSIAVDKPFEVGDFIVVDSIAGSVEHVGLKSTRIRSLSGEQIVMSNTELLKRTISNYKRLRERRVVFKFGVTYETKPDQAEAIPAIVKRLVQSHDRLRFDRAHFQGFGDSSLDFEVVYFVLDSDYNLYMDLQQSINLALMRELEGLGIGFAFPTRTVYLVPAPEDQKTRPEAVGQPA